MRHAPIIIPTLNRLEHLTRCLRSLERNTGANETEVYISVDYPPAEKYWNGYLEVKEWLNENAKKLKFKAVYVYCQEQNLGPRNNIHFLENWVREKFDSYIFTEDDNEFSPNFLEYINKGLDLYEENENVFGICAAKDTEWISNKKNITCVKQFPAYGFGSWFSKEDRMKKQGQELLLNTKKMLKPANMWKLFLRNRCLFNIYICEVLCKEDGLFWQEDNLYWCDSIKSIYMHFSDLLCIVPEVAKSRTWGNDGSGVNMQATVINPEEKWPLDKEVNFTYDHIELCYNEGNYKLGSEYLSSIVTFKGTIKAILYYLLLLCCQKDRRKAISVLKK